MDVEKNPEQDNFRLSNPERSISEFAIEQSGIERPIHFNAELERANVERLAGMLNRRQALRAKDANQLTVFLKHSIAKKLYRCPCCQNDIAIGSEHVVMSRVQMAKTYTHHHVDFSCIKETILPNLSSIEVISPEQASATAVNKRARRYRNKRRR